jgi:MFS family permease
MIGIWGCIAGIAAMTGPLIGGAVTQALSWEWVFWVNVPIGIVASALALLRLSESFGPPTRLDPVAVILVSGGVTGIVFGPVRAAELGSLSVQALAPLGLGVVLMGAFLGWERRAEEPMLPLRLFRSLPFSAANTTSSLCLRRNTLGPS